MSFEELRTWIGRTQRQVETLDLSRLRGLAAALGDDLAVERGTPVPPGWHWLFFNPMVPRQEVGPDGHPARGGFLPPIDLPRRMWAGGELVFEDHLLAGEEATRDSEIVSIEPKTGKQGALVFVTVRHRVSAGSRMAIDEIQNLVYRNPVTAPGPRATVPVPSDRPASQWSGPFRADEVLLFRYSALTFNGHRIHYDKEYATREEGYPALVVHGPLTATVLMRVAERHSGSPDVRKPLLKRFTYRGVAPLFVHEQASLEGALEPDGALSLWARKADGTEVMSARAELRS